MHCSSQRTFQNKPPRRKDRQRYPLYLTVFWFPLACISKKTVGNTVKLSATFKLAQRLSYYLSISISYAVSLPDLTMHLATVAVFISG